MQWDPLSLTGVKGKRNIHDRGTWVSLATDSKSASFDPAQITSLPQIISWSVRTEMERWPIGLLEAIPPLWSCTERNPPLLTSLMDMVE